MSDRKDKLVMAYLCGVCKDEGAHLVSPHAIAEALCHKVVLSVAEIDEIMTNLSMQNYLDFVVSDSKNGYYYCITLKSKGRSFLIDAKKQRKALLMLVLRSMFLATVSFVFGIILKAIFK